MKTIYLDHNATTPVDPRVLKAMLPFFTEIYGNAASVDHEFGHVAHQAVEKGRTQVARLINASPDEMIFTSGATESDNIALLGVAAKYASRGKHVITTRAEHKAVLDCAAQLEKRGFEVTYLRLDQYGQVDPADVARAIRPDTILVSLMAANNEVGTLAPLAEIGHITRSRDVLFHTDATQAVGHIPIDVEAMRIDLLSMSAHKFYGPKGIGVLYRRKSNPRVLLEPVIYGGGHERGVRSGTLNVPGIVGMGVAAELAGRLMKEEMARTRELTQWLLEFFRSNLLGVELNGHPTNRLPHNLNISVEGIESRALIVQLKTVAVSTGSACTTAKVEPSHVIKALGLPDTRAYSAIRIGVGRFTTSEETLAAGKEIMAHINALRRL